MNPKEPLKFLRFSLTATPQMLSTSVLCYEERSSPLTSGQHSWFVLYWIPKTEVNNGSFRYPIPACYLGDSTSQAPFKSKAEIRDFLRQKGLLESLHGSVPWQ